MSDSTTSDSNLTNPTPVFFLKELTTNPVIVSGTVVRWEDLGGDNGCLATNDKRLIEGLRGFIKRRLGGVSEIDGDDFENKKKQLSASGQVFESWRESQRIGLRPRQHAVADANPFFGKSPEVQSATVPAAPVAGVPAAEPVPTVAVSLKLAPEAKPSEASRPVAQPIVIDKVVDSDLF